MANVTLHKITSHLLDHIVPANQCGFRYHHGMINMISSIRLIQETCCKQSQCLNLLFMDLMKAFDTFSHVSLRQVLSKLGCPPKIISIARSFHNGMIGRDSINGGMSDVLPITNGVKQGCVLVPAFFSPLFAAVLLNMLS